jgi:hypothetical protein
MDVFCLLCKNSPLIFLEKHYQLYVYSRRKWVAHSFNIKCVTFQVLTAASMKFRVFGGVQAGFKVDDPPLRGA